MRLFLPSLLLAACAKPRPCALPEPEAVERPNLLVVVIDDAGIDQYAPWGASPDPVPAPTMDCLCDAGLRFDRAWASPYCSPARVALLSGQHPRRYDVGRFVNVSKDTWELPLDEITLAEGLASSGYSSAFVGKWHISAFNSETSFGHPEAQGFDVFSGTLGNLGHQFLTDESGSYDVWEHVHGDLPGPRRGYATSAVVDDTLEILETLPEPWLVVAAFHAPHKPLHSPPNALLSEPLGRNPTELEQFRAMVEAVDTELGRLLADMDQGALARTQIWTLSDNGTPAHGIAPPLDPGRGKGTVFEGGLRVPMVVTGAGVGAAGEHSDALVSILDVYPSLLAAAGAPEVPSDGLSLLPLLDDPSLAHHTVLYGDLTGGEGQVRRAVRSAHGKLVLGSDGTEQAYALGDGLQEDAIDAPEPGLREALDAFIASYQAE